MQPLVMLLAALNTLSSSPPDSDASCSDISTPLRVVVGITCSLSMLGSLLIILSYCLIPSIRTKGREILLNLSLMDFIAAAGNCTGIAVNFNDYLGSSVTNRSAAINRLCVAQAAFAQYGTISSILWTVSLATYIYLCIMLTNKRIAIRSVWVFYAICYGIPLIISLWYILTDKLGFDEIGGSGWCSVILESNGQRWPLNIVFTNDIWIYMTIVIVPMIFVALHYHLKREMHKSKTILTQSWKVTMQTVEVKLLFIPVIFILLRIWSLLLTVIVVEANCHLSCTVIKFFLYMSGIGDSGQGFFNGILYVLFSQKVRSYLLQLLCCYKKPAQTNVSLNDERSTFYGSFSSDRGRRSEEREFSEEESDTESVSSKHRQHKSLLLNS